VPGKLPTVVLGSISLILTNRVQQICCVLSEHQGSSES